MFYIYSIFSFIFGTIIGSFLNVLIYRLPKDLPITGRSHCTNCSHVLGPLELVPLLSFSALGRKCRNCKQKISWQYFIIELLTGLLFLAAFIKFLPNNPISWLLFLKAIFLISILVVVFSIDFEHYLILDRVIFPSSVVVIIFNLLIIFWSSNIWFDLNSPLMGGIVAALTSALPFFLIWFFSQGRWMGFGDVKLMLFLGLALGWTSIWAALFLAIFIGGALSIILLVKGKKTLKSQIPFGTFLSLGAVLAIFFGPQLIVWYLGILGF